MKSNQSRRCFTDHGVWHHARINHYHGQLQGETNGICAGVPTSDEYGSFKYSTEAKEYLLRDSSRKTHYNSVMITRETQETITTGDKGDKTGSTKWSTTDRPTRSSRSSRPRRSPVINHNSTSPSSNVSAETNFPRRSTIDRLHRPSLLNLCRETKMKEEMILV
ncbi:hypothetical protein KIN20_023014 [Parelaphostrongylus tenuis]|uniref:Uncharacterized protein n=1 Tax=Parelaphostrongylus tenuis TaxID=148309 RepID=A0AAD5N6P7_PARTN|nr:hypothetical protein KIN20_023014 [Parelaphostrongylus tenuis]